MHTLPKGVDYGWDYAPGASVQSQMQGFVGNKITALPKPLAEAFKADVNAPGSFNAARDYVLKNGLAHASKEIEFGYVYDAKGNVLVKRMGEENKIEFIDSEIALIKESPGVVLVHNHPSGRSLSEDDFLFAHYVDGDVYAIGHNGIDYSGRVLDIQRLKGLYSEIDDQIGYYFHRLMLDKSLSKEDAYFYQNHLLNTVLYKAGIIAYAANGIAELSPAIELILNKLLEEFT